MSIKSGDVTVTSVVQKAIDQCSSNGGGIVTLPAGTWVSGPLTLKSHVTLHLAAGSTLKSTGNPDDFVPAFISQPTHPREALIIASHVQDIAITGPGTIDGQGQKSWWSKASDAREHLKHGDVSWFEKNWKGIPPANGMPRPWLIEFDHVQGGNISQLHIINSPMWNLVLRNSENIDVSRSSIFNPPDSPNTDGIDVVSSKNISLRHLKLSTGDDDIAIKSGLASTGKAPPSSNINIDDIDIYRGHGLSVGSETANGIGRVTMQNVRFNGTDNGLRIKSGRDRGNQIGPISADNITMNHVNVPLVITDSYGGNGGYSSKSLTSIPTSAISSLTPFIHDVTIQHLTATNSGMAGIISGLPEAPLQNITLKDIHIDATHGLQSRYVSGEIKNVHVTSKERDLPLLQGPDSHWDNG
ncbi:glycoside hydrolase family 28 protein [Enterobacter soli]|uniref:glycoside hydrolase family 28 protein n=1 Tax=Enterobacter soli TaxID=885040 RepID=UPI000FFE542F|nr:glycosyl hydrolase family 28 protein [Enterobacter soli]